MCSLQLWYKPSELQQAAIKAVQQEYGRSVRASMPVFSVCCVHWTMEGTSMRHIRIDRASRSACSSLISSICWGMKAGIVEAAADCTYKAAKFPKCLRLELELSLTARNPTLSLCRRAKFA